MDRARLQPVECRHGTDAVHRQPRVPRHVGLQASARRTHKTHARMHAHPPGVCFARSAKHLRASRLRNMRTKHGGPTRHERTTCLQKELRDQYGVAGCIPHEHIKGVSCDRAKQRGVFVDRYGATCSIGTPRHRWPFRSGRTPHDYTASLVNAVIAVLRSRDVYSDPTFTIFRAGQNDCNFSATVAQRGWESLEYRLARPATPQQTLSPHRPTPCPRTLKHARACAPGRHVHTRRHVHAQRPNHSPQEAQV